MTKNRIIGVLCVGLLLSLAGNAYLFIDRTVFRFYNGNNIDMRTRVMNAYDQLVCDLICGKTIDEANQLIKPHTVVRFKQRRDLAHLHIKKTRVELCLQGDVITAVESSTYSSEKPECLKNIYLFDGTSQGEILKADEK